MADIDKTSETATAIENGSGLPPALLSGPEAEQVFRMMLEEACFDLDDVASGPGSRRHILNPKVISECLQHPDEWDILAIDATEVELDPTVAAVLHIRNEMLKRYDRLVAFDKSHYSELPDAPKAVMFLLNDIDCLFAMSDMDDEASKAENAKRDRDRHDAHGDRVPWSDGRHSRHHWRISALGHKQNIEDMGMVNLN